MDIWTLLRTIFRRWYVSLPIIALATFASYTLAEEEPPLYTAQSSAVLAPPELVDDPRVPGEFIETNPLLSLGGSLNTTTQVLIVRMDSVPLRLSYEEKGLLPTYSVDRGNAVMFFEVEGDNEEDVVQTARELVALADDEIAAMQEAEDVIPEARIRAVPVILPMVAQEDNTPALTLLAVGIALGLLLAVVAAVAVEGLVRWFAIHRTSPSAIEHQSGEPKSRPTRPRAARWRAAPRDAEPEPPANPDRETSAQTSAPALAVGGPIRARPTRSGSEHVDP